MASDQNIPVISFCGAAFIADIYTAAVDYLDRFIKNSSDKDQIGFGGQKRGIQNGN